MVLANPRRLFGGAEFFGRSVVDILIVLGVNNWRECLPFLQQILARILERIILRILLVIILVQILSVAIEIASFDISHRYIILWLIPHLFRWRRVNL